ncbi:uncharacterized protein LOC115881633 [Sitophilus oryzae]|uniref:Uncharacterized protein LOC115881633 n=1 Tax=Sitophilus oryzae TaxID=7048 RepID=A0A6J2XVH5_SITOR|nr:uncharacterized protein LOC115881633 [Sitophilus oryzae]
MSQPIINAEDCKNIVRKYLDSDKFEYVTFKIKPFIDNERDYFKGDSLLEISVKISKNISRIRVFLKKYHWKYKPLVLFLQSIHAFERELRFYEVILPKIINSLKNYELDIAPHYMFGKANDFIVLEDLSLDSFVVAKKMNPHILDRFHISLGLQTLAKLHSAFIAHQEICKGTKESLDSEELILEEPFLKDGKILESSVKSLKSLLEIIRESEHFDKDLGKKLDDLVIKSIDLVKPQKKYRNVLCHGNLHTRDMLFRYEGNSPVQCNLLNFEYCKYYVPAYDVLTFIFFTTSSLFRQHYYTYLIQYYYDNLKSELAKLNLQIEDILPVTEYHETINILMPTIKLKTCLHLQDFGAKKGFYDAIKKNEQLYNTYLYENKSECIKEILRMDPIFKIMMTEALKELIEVVEITLVYREDCYKLLEEELQTTLYDIKDYEVSASEGSDNKLLNLVIRAVTGDKQEDINEFKYSVVTENRIKKFNKL